MNDEPWNAPRILLAVIGAGAIVNGIWMLADTARWFGKLAAVTGELNPHLVRDVGAAYVTAGVALVWAALRPRVRAALTTTAAIFLGLHALFHLIESVAGILPPGHWIEDLPGVYLPAVVTITLSVLFLRAPERSVS